MNTSDTLNRAADLIEQRGWTAGDGWVAVDTMDTAPLCLEGGIQAAIGHALPTRIKGCALPDGVFDGLHDCPAYRAVSAYLDTDEHLFWWNDERHRTASEVVEVLRACAVIESARERETAAVS